MIQCGGCKNFLDPALRRCPVCGTAAAAAAAPAAAAAATASARLAHRSVGRSVNVIAAMFAAQVAAVVAGGAGLGLDWRESLAAVNVAIWVAVLAAAWVGWLPRWARWVGLVGPPFAALVYLGACHGAIARLGPAHRLAAWVGCVGLAVLSVLPLVAA